MGDCNIRCVPFPTGARQPIHKPSQWLNPPPDSRFLAQNRNALPAHVQPGKLGTKSKDMRLGTDAVPEGDSVTALVIGLDGQHELCVIDHLDTECPLDPSLLTALRRALPLQLQEQSHF